MASAAVSPDILSSPSEKRASRFGAVDAFLAVLICGLGFLLASTSARNSDLWLHLASGRSISERLLPAGKDPFSSTTQGVFWVNHTWLSDLLLYQIFKLGDGTALVVAKGILIALLAALLLCFRRRNEGFGISAWAGFLALLALGPWLSLQPGLVSLLGVSLTLYLLERPALFEDVSVERARVGRWFLVPLFALWANLDGWFFLGPVIVGLYALGGLLRRPTTARSVSQGMAVANAPVSDVLLLCVALAACLATPYHYHIFDWPAQLGLTHTEQVLQHDPLGQTLVVSPFGSRFVATSLFRSPGIWAYYLLLGVSGVSFVLTIPTLNMGRFLVWMALAALSIYQARAIPFFAVAAAPLLALNLEGWGERSEIHRGARALGVLAGLMLLVTAWPGWLQVAPFQSRGWTVEPNGSLVRMADRLKRRHAEALLPPDRFTLTFSPEAANYLSWYCPEEKGFVDSRWQLFDRVCDDFVHIRSLLFQEDAGSQELAALLDAHHIDRILLYDADWERMGRAYFHLVAAAPQWELSAVEGGASLFRRKRDSTLSPPPFDYRRAAYHPVRDECVPPPPRPPQPPRWFDAFYRHPDPGAADREEATLHLLTFDLQETASAKQLLVAEGMGRVGSRRGIELLLRIHVPPPLPPQPPEPLLLALRAARRALAVNPDDARAFLILGEAYVRLVRKTREASWGGMLPDLAAVRQAEMLTALELAVALRPDLALAHDLLARLYKKEGEMDRSLDHLRALLQAAEKAGEHSETTAALRSEVTEMEKLVSQSEKTYQANLTGKTNPSKVLDRAQLAARFGLARKALEMLQESYPAIYGKAGAEYRLDLMIKAGQGFEILEVLAPEVEFKISQYHWLKARAAAGCGDYAQADAELDKDTEPIRRVGLSPKLFVPVRTGMALHIGRAILNRSPDAEGIAGRVAALRFQVESMDAVGMASGLLRQEADRQVLRGLLNLESGSVTAAKQHFHAAVSVWDSEAAAAVGSGLDFPARRIAREMLRRMED